ncbi:hypothetical protein ACA910_006624 [Epithemia clementina (nom. ined.)]
MRTRQDREKENPASKRSLTSGLLSSVEDCGPLSALRNSSKKVKKASPKYKETVAKAIFTADVSSAEKSSSTANKDMYSSRIGVQLGLVFDNNNEVNSPQYESGDNNGECVPSPAADGRVHL